MKKTDAMKELAELLAPKPANIHTAELEDFLSLQRLLREVRERERALKAELDAAEADLMGRLKAGVKVYGKLTATIVKESGDCRPPWKEIYLNHMVEHGVQPAAAEQEAREQHPAELKERLVVGEKPR